MAFIGLNPGAETFGFTPLSADPTNPFEGQMFYSNGTPRAEGIWVYKNAAWVLIAEGSAGALSVVTKSGSTTLLITEDVVGVNTSGGDVTLTLPTAVGNSGKVFTIIKTTTDSNHIIIDGNGAETVNGFANDYIGVAYSPFEYVSDGTNFIYKNSSMSRVTTIYDEKSGSADSGTFNSGSWKKRDLNTIDGDESFVSISSNQFTLQPGEYIISAGAQAFEVETHLLRVRDVTNSNSYTGTACRSNNDSGSEATVPEMRVRISASATFELQHQCSATQATNGYGVRPAFQVTNRYAWVTIKKVS